MMKRFLVFAALLLLAVSVVAEPFELGTTPITRQMLRLNTKEKIRNFLEVGTNGAVSTANLLAASNYLFSVTAKTTDLLAASNYLYSISGGGGSFLPTLNGNETNFISWGKETNRSSETHYFNNTNEVVKTHTWSGSPYWANSNEVAILSFDFNSSNDYLNLGYRNGYSSLEGVQFFVDTKGKPSPSSTPKMGIYKRASQEAADVLPGVAATNDIGSAALPWRDAYFAEEIYLESGGFGVFIRGGTIDPELAIPGAKGAVYLRAQFGWYLKTVDSIGGNNARGWVLQNVSTDFVLRNGGVWTNGLGYGFIRLSSNSAALQAPPSGTILHIGHADGVQTRVLVDSYGIQSANTFRRANGTADSPSALLANENITSINGFGFGATVYSASSRIQLVYQTSENWTDTAQGSRMIGYVNPNGTATAGGVEAWRVEQNGNFGIGTNAPAEKGHILGNLRLDSGNLKLGAITTNSIPETDTSWIFSQTNGSGIAQSWTMSEDGTATLLSAHADDAPAGFYYITNYTRMVPEIKKSVNPFQVGGVVEWKNISLQLYLQKIQLLGTNLSTLPAGIRAKIADALYQEETFSEYNTRMNYTNGHPNKLVALNWQTVQDGHQLKYDLGRSNELFRISQGETNLTARPVKNVKKLIPHLIDR